MDLLKIYEIAKEAFPAESKNQAFNIRIDEEMIVCHWWCILNGKQVSASQAIAREQWRESIHIPEVFRQRMNNAKKLLHREIESKVVY